MQNEMNPAPGKVAKKRKARRTDGTAHNTPWQLAERWGWHPESVRRAIRQGRIAAVVISRRLLVPTGEIERIEHEGRIGRGVGQ